MGSLELAVSNLDSEGRAAENPRLFGAVLAPAGRFQASRW